MDPLAGINIAGDSSFALMLSAQTRGHELWHYDVRDLTWLDGRVTALATPVSVQAVVGDHFTLGEPRRIDLGRDIDVVLMRQDPPFDIGYLTGTWLLERIAGETLVVNDPRGLRDLNEKLAALLFPQCCPPSLVSRDPDLLREFIARHGRCVLKPLDGMGGRSIFQVSHGDPNTNVILETLLDNGRQLAMAQKYLPEIREGDKRILLVDGEPVPYCLARIPQGTEFRGNLAAGGRGEGRPLTDRDRWIAGQVGPELRRRGMLFVGLDVIGDFLTEVNVTSPTCVRELDQQFGLNIAGQLFDVIEARCETRH